MKELPQAPLPSVIDPATALRYAVAIPVIEHDGEWELLFECRPTFLRDHPGEIAFPGGRIESTDENASSAAIREMKEELGIVETDWTMIGALPLAYTYRGRLVAPYVVCHQGPPQLSISPSEVTEVFSVPLSWLNKTTPETVVMQDGVEPGENFPFDRVLHYQKGWNRRATYNVFVYRYGRFTIWGLTARILQSFLATDPFTWLPDVRRSWENH